MRILRSLILTMIALFACVGTASATKISMQAETTSGIFFPGVSASAPPRIRIYYNKSFTESAGHHLVLGGAPNGQGASNVYLEIITTWSAGVCNIPAYQLDSTDDALDDQTATCSYFWYGAQGNYIGPVQGLSSLVIYAHQASIIGCSPASTCAFLVDLKVSNFGHINPGNPTATYSTVEIDRKIAAVLVSATGFPDPGSSGILARTAPNVATPRSIVPGSANVLITNQNGISGNPTIDLATNVVESASAPLVISGNNLSIPAATNSVDGYLTAGDRTAFNAKQAALGFTPENPANKNVANGYVGLSAGSKIANSQLSQVLGVTDLTTYTQAFGSGTHAIKATFGAPGNALNAGDLVQWNGSNFVNIPAGSLGGGTVTNVGLATNASWFTISNSPITATGNLTFNLTTGLTQNQVTATPDGAPGAVGLRSLVNNDLPTVNAAHGGSGLATLTTYALLAGGTTATGNFQQVSGLGSLNQVLTSNGPGALPTWQNAAGGTVAFLTATDATFSAPLRGGVVTAQGSGTPSWTQLGLGAAGVALTSNGTDLVYGPVSLTAGVSGVTPIANGGTNATSANYATNGSAYYDGTRILTTATGGAGTLCLTATDGGAPTWGSCAGSAATSWSSLTSPGGNLALNMLTFRSTITYGTRADANDNFTIQSTTGNTGTGHLVSFSTIGTDTMKVFMASAKGQTDGVEMGSDAILKPIGAGGITANALNGVAGNGIQVRTSAGNFTSRSVAAGVGITITNGDGVSGNPTITGDLSTLVANQTIFDGSQASRTITFNLSGTDPVLTLGSGVFNVSTGTIQQGGTAVVLQSYTLTGGTGINALGDLSAGRTVSVNQGFSPTWTGVHTFTPTARDSSIAPYFELDTPADTNITANTESIGFKTVTAKRTFRTVTTTFPVQREFVFDAPSYAFNGSSTIGTAATVAITGAPILAPGGNITITNPYAFWVQSGTTRFDAKTIVNPAGQAVESLTNALSSAYGFNSNLYTVLALQRGVTGLAAEATPAPTVNFQIYQRPTLSAGQTLFNYNFASVAEGTSADPWEAIYNVVSTITTAAPLASGFHHDIIGFAGRVNVLSGSSAHGFAFYGENTASSTLGGAVAELDAINSSGTTAATAASQASPFIKGWEIVGRVSGGGSLNNTSALSVTAQANASFLTGLYFYSGAISSTGAAIDIADVTNSDPLRIHNNVFIKGRDNANSNNLSMIGVSSADKIYLDPGGKTIVAGTGANPITTAAGSLILPTLDGARVYNNANISLANGFTTVTFNSERFDNGNLHSTSSNTSRITIATTGTYVITGHVVMAGSASGAQRVLRIQLNGVNFIASQEIITLGGSQQPEIAIATIYRLTAGDYVELVAFQDTGGALNLLASPNYSPEFAVQFISP